MNLKNYITSKSSLLNSRTSSVLKNIGIGFFTKGLSIAISFIQIPVTLSILTKTEYGIWLTLFSVAGWLAYFDLGIGNGLRNKLTEALAENDIIKAKSFVSTAYVSIGIVFTSIVFLFLIVAPFIPWTRVLNESTIALNDLKIVVYCCFIFTVLNFVANLIQILFAANHLTGKGSVLILFAQILILASTVIIKYLDIANAFIWVGVLLSVIPFFVNILASLFYFSTRFKNIAPSLGLYKKEYLKSVMSVGIKFFIIQMAVLIVFSTDNFLITQLYSPEEVANYNFVYKYFSVISLFFGIVTTPLWTMYTDAYKKNDIAWINKNVNYVLKLLGIAAIGVIIMTLSSNFIMNLWLGNAYTSTMLFVFLVGIYTLQTVWNNIFVLPLNAIGKLNLQVGFAIWAAVVNIPLALFLNKYIHNINSIVIANILSILAGSIIIYFQYQSEFKNSNYRVKKFNLNYKNTND